MGKKKVAYTGVLGKPREYVPLTGKKGQEKVYSEVASVQEIMSVLAGAISKEYFEERRVSNEYLSMLMEFYGIDSQMEDSWYQLALRLAQDHVPCFHFEKAKRGRPKKWDKVRKCELIAHVEEICRENPNLTAKSACERLKKNRIFTENSLYIRYLEAKKVLESNNK